MIVTPATIIHFLNVPWTSDYKFICDGATLAQILATKVKEPKTNYTYQRKDNRILVDYTMDELINCNYVVFLNSATESYIYAFVESLVYINVGTTALVIKTDVYHTHKSRFTFGHSFVVRQHVNDDVAGNYNIPEGLETGDFIQNSNNLYAQMGDMDIIVMTSKSSEGISATGQMYNNIYGACFMYGSTSASTIGTFINESGQVDAIISIFMSPHELTKCTSALKLILPADLSNNKNVTAPSRPATINGYTPINKKLHCYPYSFLYAHNNAGSSAVFKWELFSGTPVFMIYGAVSPNSVLKMIPTNLKGNGVVDADQGLTIGGYPMCSWNSSVYKNWITQNGMGAALNVAGSVLALGAGVATGNPIALGDGILGVLNQVATFSQKLIAPPQTAGAVNSPSASCTNNWNDFTFYAKSITAEYARMIDDYFSMFGYKINRVKVPTLTGRAQWNYIQTVDCIIKGGIPEEDKKQLQQIFNNGVTVWHNISNIGNYGLANGVL